MLSLEDEEGSGHDESKTYGVIPGQAFSQVERGEDTENSQGNDFLYGLELGGGKIAVAYSVGRNLEAVFEKGYAPADENGPYEGEGMVTQMPVPGIGHEDVGADEQNDGDERNGQMKRHDGLVVIFVEKERGARSPLMI